MALESTEICFYGRIRRMKIPWTEHMRNDQVFKKMETNGHLHLISEKESSISRGHNGLEN